MAVTHICYKQPVTSQRQNRPAITTESITHHYTLSRVVSLEVFLGLVGIGLDSVRARGPGGGAGLAHMAVSPLEGLQQTKSLLHIAADGIIVDLDGADNASRIYAKN